MTRGELQEAYCDETLVLLLQNAEKKILIKAFLAM